MAPCRLQVQVAVLSLCGNKLSGPAFPAAWLQPGAMDALQYLCLSGNPGITGTLPANLSWPMLHAMCARPALAAC